MISQREVYQALLDGKILQRKTDQLIIKIDCVTGLLVGKNGNKQSAYFDIPQDWQEYKKPQWYDNIPGEGVICWVSDYVENDMLCARLIHKYKEHDGFFSGSTPWKYARPVKPEECYQCAK